MARLVSSMEAGSRKLITITADRDKLGDVACTENCVINASGGGNVTIDGDEGFISRYMGLVVGGCGLLLPRGPSSPLLSCDVARASKKAAVEVSRWSASASHGMNS